MSHPASMRWPIGALIVAALAIYLVGNDRINLWDRDEPRYAQCSRQMLESGDWVVPHYLDRLRTEKPPLIYWLQASAMSILGVNSFAARLPSSLAMAATAALLGLTIARYIGPRRAFWTVLIFASSVMVIVSAKMCLTDAVLLLLTTIAQICLFAIYSGRGRWPIIVAFWAVIGIGGLVKGPVVLGVPAATAVVLAAMDIARTGRAGIRNTLGWLWRTRPLVGLLIVTAIASPWLILVHHRDPRFLPALFGAASRHMGTAALGHKGPPGYYLATVWAFFLPWCLLLPLTLALAYRNRRIPAIRFALAAVIGPWIMVEIVKTKLPHYLLPVYPPLALLMADAIIRCLRGQYPDFRRRAFAIGAAAWTLILTGVAVGPWILILLGLDSIHHPEALAHINEDLRKALQTFQFRPQPWFGLAAFSATALAYVWLVFILVLRRRHAAALKTMGLGMLALMAVTAGVLLPSIQYVQTSRRVAEILHADGATPQRLRGGEILMIDYKEPSLSFYQGGQIREESNSAYLSNTDPGAWPRWLVLTDEVWKSVPAELQRHWKPLGSVRGLAYADSGRVVEVLVLRNRADAVSARIGNEE